MKREIPVKLYLDIGVDQPMLTIDCSNLLIIAEKLEISFILFYSKIWSNFEIQKLS